MTGVTKFTISHIPMSNSLDLLSVALTALTSLQILCFIAPPRIAGTQDVLIPKIKCPTLAFLSPQLLSFTLHARSSLFDASDFFPLLPFFSVLQKFELTASRMWDVSTLIDFLQRHSETLEDLFLKEPPSEPSWITQLLEQTYSNSSPPSNLKVFRAGSLCSFDLFEGYLQASGKTMRRLSLETRLSLEDLDKLTRVFTLSNCLESLDIHVDVLSPAVIDILAMRLSNLKVLTIYFHRLALAHFEDATTADDLRFFLSAMPTRADKLLFATRTDSDKSIFEQDITNQTPWIAVSIFYEKMRLFHDLKFEQTLFEYEMRKRTYDTWGLHTIRLFWHCGEPTQFEWQGSGRLLSPIKVSIPSLESGQIECLPINHF